MEKRIVAKKSQRQEVAVKTSKSRKKSNSQAKIFVIDTSVILYNHGAILDFEDNDVAIPITVLEEIDQFKKGNDTKNFEAREFARILDKLSQSSPLQDWVPVGNSRGGRIRVVMNKPNGLDATLVFGEDKPDHRILNTAIFLARENPERKIILVTKDINLRLKAKSLNIAAEDFETGKVKNVDELYSGKREVSDADPTVIEQLYDVGYCEPGELGLETPTANEYFIVRNNSNSVLAYYNPVSGHIERIDKRTIQKITPRNAEQVFSLHAILNPDVKLVSLQGIAGTGKTLLALAGALDQRRDFDQLFVARPIIPLSNRDIGFLPGDVASKVSPYMEPLYDNLKFIHSQYREKDKEFKNITEALENERIVVSPLAYIRGRSLSNIIFIIDEAQNLTPHEIKTIITRAGENTKMIFTGDIFQIDTPYLDSQSNGLSYLIDRVKGNKLYAHIKLEKGERSELANLANNL
ncbi:MAG: PhoH family protein [Bacteroidetes bacterium]|nr:MAG: PhoH family protein [Bacteroidota bacterium]